MSCFKKIITGFFILFSIPAVGQRQMEKLNHGLVAVNTNSGVFVSWRVSASEMEAVEFNLYRDGIKLNETAINGASNFLDPDGTLSSVYEIRTLINNLENELNETASVWSNKYIDIPVRMINGSYSSHYINDASVGDLDGDGDYEIVVKRLAYDMTVESTDYHFLEAYKIDGTFLWAINIGPNIYNDKEFNFLVWDLDGDGKAEIATRTSEGTIDGLGNEIGDIDGDGITNYRYSITDKATGNGFRSEGPDFLSIFEGITGEELTRDNYIAREPIAQWGLPGMNLDQLAHRGTKCMFTVAYLDGKTPSVVISRGIYEKIAMEAWSYRNGQLTKNWYFASDQQGNGDYAKQGFHSLTQGDVDNDGRDEVMYGSMCIDDDGTGLYTTKLGHGDAQHLADINPDRKGLEYFGCLESTTGGNYRDAETGEIFFYYSIGRDMGRAGCSDVTPDYPGMEMWGATGFPFLSSTGKEITNLNIPSSVNFFIWWDGDPIRELLDHSWYDTYGVGVITKYNNGQNTVLLNATGTLSNNWTKGTPVVSADILGDWREEVIWRTDDNSALRLYTTTYLTEEKIYTLMHDPQYRAAIGWQPNSYNQPPHPSFFIGHEMDSIPPAPILLEGQKVWKNGIWNLSANDAWDEAGMAKNFENGDSLLFDLSGDNSIDIIIEGDLNPADIRVISPTDYNFSGTGSINGNTKLTKAGEGKLTINTENNYSGITRIWGGTFFVNGVLKNSMVLAKRFSTVGGSGHFMKGINLEKYATLIVSDTIGAADSVFIESHLSLAGETKVYMDLSDDPTGISKTNDIIIIDGNLNFDGKTRIYINTLDGTLSIGTYTLAKVSGSFSGLVENISVLGISSIAFTLSYENGLLLLNVPVTRPASTVVWQGAVDNEWDIYNTPNWLKNGIPDYFIGNDTVIFNDEALQTDINIMGIYSISHLLCESTKNISISGEGYFTGEASLLKRGTGKLSLNTLNTYTGITTIEQGVITIPEIKNGNTPSGIGSASSDPENLVLNGGTLEILSSGSTSTDRGISLGENNGGLSISTGGADVSFYSPITGSGYLIKYGSGSLFLSSNSHKGTIINTGTIQLINEEANYTGPGEEVIFRGGTLSMYNNVNSYTDGCNWGIVIEQDQTGSLIMDGRSSLSGTLTGKGVLNLHTPWVRNEVAGNWSQFEGKINVSTDNDGGLFLIGNTSGFGKASLFLGNSLTAIYTNSTDAVIEIGELTGSSGSVLGAGGSATNTITWRVGGKNTDAIYDGVINNSQFKNMGASAAITKMGSGRWTLTGSNSYSGNTLVEKGTLILENSEGSATGSGNVYCKTGAYLAGNGSVSGNVTIEDGATFLPAYSSIGSFQIGRDFTLSENSTMMVDLDLVSETIDLTDVTGKITLNGILLITNLSAESYKDGDFFQVFKAGSIEGSFQAIYPLKPGEGLRWDTSALNSNGILRIDKTTGTDEIISVKGFVAYPNPFGDEVFLQTEMLIDRQQIKLYSMAGALTEVEFVKTSPLNWRIKTSKLTPGKYLISINQDGYETFSSVLLKIQ